MKIKIVRRYKFHRMPKWKETEYDVYHGFPVYFIFPFPFYTKWIKDKTGLKRKDLVKYLRRFVDVSSPYKADEIKIEL